MNEQRIREIANESSYHAENSVDYYTGIVDGLTWEAKILKARDLKFAELLVKECMDVLDPGTNQLIARFQARQWLAEHFGVK